MSDEREFSKTRRHEDIHSFIHSFILWCFFSSLRGTLSCMRGEYIYMNIYIERKVMSDEREFSKTRRHEDIHSFIHSFILWCFFSSLRGTFFVVYEGRIHIYIEREKGR